MKALFKALITAICVFTLTTACTKAVDGIGSGDNVHEIMFIPSFSATAVPSKAFLYDENNIILNGQGDFSVISYLSGTNTRHFLQPERVSYWFEKWMFYDADKNSDYKRYWPQTYALDFLAYMPYDLAGVNLDTRQFGYTLPLDKTGQDSAKEFIYAFEEEERYTETNKGKVNLEFKHPYAAVKFILGEAHGNTTVHSISLTDMKYSGTFDFPTDEWDLSDTRGSMDIDITDVTVGAGLNTGGQIGDTYLVLPQPTDGIGIRISFTWNSETTDGTADLGSGSWEAGHIYTYKLKLGDNDEDILADIIVEPWSIEEYKHEIDVE